MTKPKRTKSRKPRKTAKATTTGMWPWYLAAVVLIGGVTAYDNREAIGTLPAMPKFAAMMPSERTVQKPASRQSRQSDERLQTGSLPKPAQRPVEAAVIPPATTPPATIRPTVASGPFFYCTDLKTNCVADSDTFWYGGEKIRLADIDAPGTKQAKCDKERKQGSLARGRLRELLNQGDFTLAAASGEATTSGRGRIVLRDGHSIGDRLISEGLARKWTGRKQNWC